MGILSFFSNNTYGVDPKEEESKIRLEYPYLLLDAEHIELAFKSKGEGGRDKSYFTSHRVLIKDGKGIGSKRKNYLSIPYTSIQAFSVETAGATFLDRDTQLKLWYEGGSQLYPQTIDFAKDQVNLFDVQQFFNKKVFQQDAMMAAATAARSNANSSNNNNYDQFATNEDVVKKATVESIFNWIGNDAIQLDPKSVQERFTKESPVLFRNEEVELCYQARRDVIIITPLRFFLIDVKGFTGKKMEFFSLRWDCVKAFSVETAGSQLFDRDCDFIIHTNIPSLHRLRQDLRRGKTDIFQVQTSFSNKLLGGKDVGDDSKNSNNTRVANINDRKGHVDNGASLFTIGGSNNRPLDATEVERTFRSNPPLLQSDEFVEMAFKGRRDLVIFTTKRIIDVDVKGLSGKRIEYASIPYSSILAYGVKSAGSVGGLFADKDSEVMIYTDIRWNHLGDQDNPPDPGQAYKEWDFNKNVVDILDLKRYLNARLLATEPGMKVPSGRMVASPQEHGIEKMLSKWGNDQSVIDANELNTVLHTTVDILLDDENVVMCFKAGRDITVFSNQRILIMDVQGWSGKKIEYTTIPYSSIRAFAAESAGSWDRDSEINIYTSSHWTLGKVKLDFRKGKVDIIAIQKFLSAIVLGNEQDAANYLQNINPNTVKISHPAGMNGFTDWMIDNSVEEDPNVADAQFHNDPPILLSDEKVEKVYREGRDLWVYTNLRILRVDVKGITGRKIEYRSIPWKNSCTAFAVETCGHLDRDAECYMATNIPSIHRLVQKIFVKRGNIFDMHEYLGKKLLSKESHNKEDHDHSTNRSKNPGVSADEYDPYAKYH